MSRIAAVAPVLPVEVYTQAEITHHLAPLIARDPGKRAVMSRLHTSSKVATRHLVRPLESYAALDSFTVSNDVFISEGLLLAERAIRDALEIAGVEAQDVDFLLFTTVTGVSAPSLDALLISRLGLRPDVKRMPSFGLGCVAGASGLARVHDYLAGHPDDVAILLSVELCSLTLQRDDDSMANLVASGLFGDGATAVVVLGERRAEALGARGPRIVDTSSRVYPDTEGDLGWDVGGTGFRIVLSAGMPDVIRDHLRPEVDGFLAANGLERDSVTEWMAHPGGPRVLEVFEEVLDLPEHALAISWGSLERVGNLSSSSVLHVLADTIETRPAPGAHGLLFAFGPGVSAELVLLEWPDA
ncbi:type III polyketide synthase [Compostimonas suwonensis]|uniref:Alkylresorcinol/alkylpyrone synthase n=1 Tax=Compostimonas suwonensis TaxID=1048394 RepID=A0A2M9BTT5_9MICO|nr:3-oxoacyl-[acyl-carrier-protein] synthase III C-terminal domain-containing protein [Compostimonas suwonensis]PJJ61369.1 alkylresorcinol/alkylpyrone synthase [Compostimonas suwonensis]